MPTSTAITRPLLLTSLALACGLSSACSSLRAASSPIPGLESCDALIEPSERHFAHLWRVTRGGENAEGYWSYAGDRLCLQRRLTTSECDRIFVTDTKSGELVPVSNGRGKTTCAYFLPGDRELLYASTQTYHTDCPPGPDYSQGYVWLLHPEFDIFIRDLATGVERTLTSAWGYDAEATVSPVGDRIVFTSERSGDLELWTCDLDGKDLKQVTREAGYDGGAFFSHDGKQLVFRATKFTPDGQLGDRPQYEQLLKEHKIRPHALEIMLCDADGSNRRQLTHLGGANFAPYFFAGDRRVIFSTNHHESGARNFDLFAIDVDGKNVERITSYSGFDSFPMFSGDGRYLVFASNRGGDAQGETNLYVAQWRD
jgi:dipeptidyl aminopeptidase/acylaminoacyl peptidase